MNRADSLPLVYEQQPIYSLAIDDTSNGTTKNVALELYKRTVARGPVAYELLYRGAPVASMQASDWLRVDTRLVQALRDTTLDDSHEVWINLSSTALANIPAFDLLEAKANNPRLIAEWTEQDATNAEFRAARNTIHVLGKMGFPIVVDDFAEPGTDGISRVLASKSLYGIKFAAKMLACARTSTKHASVIQMVSGLAAKNRWKLIVEGVESVEDFMLARTLGADYVQGFLFKPKSGFPKLTIREVEHC